MDKEHVQQLLGTMSDADIAHIAMCSPRWVGLLRKALGIKPLRLHRNPRKGCNGYQAYLRVLNEHPEGINGYQLAKLVSLMLSIQ